MLVAILGAAAGPPRRYGEAWALYLIALLFAAGVTALCIVARRVLTRDRIPPSSLLVLLCPPITVGFVGALSSVSDLEADVLYMVPFTAARFGVAMLQDPAIDVEWGALGTSVIAAFTALLCAVRTILRQPRLSTLSIGILVSVLALLAALVLVLCAETTLSVFLGIVVVVLGVSLGVAASRRYRTARDGAFLSTVVAAALVCASTTWLAIERSSVESFYMVFDAHPEQSSSAFSHVLWLSNAASRSAAAGLFFVVLAASIVFVVGGRHVRASASTRGVRAVSAGLLIAMVAALGVASRIQEQCFLSRLAERTRPYYLDVANLELPTTSGTRWAYSGLPTIAVSRTAVFVDGREVMATAELTSSKSLVLGEAVLAQIRRWDRAAQHTYRVMTGGHELPTREPREGRGRSQRVEPIALAVDGGIRFGEVAPVLEVLRAKGVGPIELMTHAEKIRRRDSFGPIPTGIFGSIYNTLGGRHGTLRLYVEPMDEPIGGDVTRVVIGEESVTFDSAPGTHAELCTPTLASLDALSRCAESIRARRPYDLAQLVVMEGVDFQRIVRVAEILENVRWEPTFERIELTATIASPAAHSVRPHVGQPARRAPRHRDSKRLSRR